MLSNLCLHTAYPLWLLISLGVFLTMAAMGVLILLAMTAMPDISYANDNYDVSLCMSQDKSGDEFIYAKYLAQLIDFLLVGCFLYMFVNKLRLLRKMNTTYKHPGDKRHSKYYNRARSKSNLKSDSKKQKQEAVIDAMPGKKLSPSATSTPSGTVYKNTVQFTPTSNKSNSKVY